MTLFEMLVFAGLLGVAFYVLRLSQVFYDLYDEIKKQNESLVVKDVFNHNLSAVFNRALAFTTDQKISAPYATEKCDNIKAEHEDRIYELLAEEMMKLLESILNPPMGSSIPENTVSICESACLGAIYEELCSMESVTIKEVDNAVYNSIKRFRDYLMEGSKEI